MKVEYRVTGESLSEIRELVDLIEGNQAKPESGTTACSDAGGVVEQVKTAGSAGREPGLAEELVQWVEEQLVDFRGPTESLRLRERGSRDAYRHVLSKLSRIIEARR